MADEENLTERAENEAEQQLPQPRIFSPEERQKHYKWALASLITSNTLIQLGFLLNYFVQKSFYWNHCYPDVTPRPDDDICNGYALDHAKQDDALARSQYDWVMMIPTVFCAAWALYAKERGQLYTLITSNETIQSLFGQRPEEQPLMEEEHQERTSWWSRCFGSK